MSGACEKIYKNNKEYYVFPKINPNTVYEKLQNGKYKVAYIKQNKTSNTAKKTTNTLNKTK